jgi:hypothetical protein
VSASTFRLSKAANLLPANMRIRLGCFAPHIGQPHSLLLESRHHVGESFNHGLIPAFGSTTARPDASRTPSAARGLGDAALAEEIDNKLLPQLTPQMTSDPTLLAFVDLMRMRQSDHDHGAPFRLDELEAQRPAFAAASPIFDYLLAVNAFYIDHANATVLQLLPDATGKRDGDHLWFSRQLLRGMALEAIGDRNAHGFWTEFYPGATRPLERVAIELGLAMHDKSRGRLKDVFAAGSLVESPVIREILLDNVADTALLRQQAHDPAAPAHEREIALFALLFKELTRGRYAEFLADVAGAPPEAPPRAMAALAKRRIRRLERSSRPRRLRTSIVRRCGRPQRSSRAIPSPRARAFALPNLCASKALTQRRSTSNRPRTNWAGRLRCCRASPMRAPQPTWRSLPMRACLPQTAPSPCSAPSIAMRRPVSINAAPQRRRWRSARLGSLA